MTMNLKQPADLPPAGREAFAGSLAYLMGKADVPSAAAGYPGLIEVSTKEKRQMRMSAVSPHDAASGWSNAPVTVTH